MRHVTIPFSLLLTMACSSGLQEPTFPTGSQTAISSRDLSAVLVVDEDHGAVSRFKVADGSVSSVEVGGRPERIAPLTAAFLDAAGDSELTTRTSG